MQCIQHLWSDSYLRVKQSHKTKGWTLGACQRCLCIYIWGEGENGFQGKVKSTPSSALKGLETLEESVTGWSLISDEGEGKCLSILQLKRSLFISTKWDNLLRHQTVKIIFYWQTNRCSNTIVSQFWRLKRGCKHFIKSKTTFPTLDNYFLSSKNFLK